MGKNKGKNKITFMMVMTSLASATSVRDLNKNNFDKGTYNNTKWNSNGFVQLGSGNVSGRFVSQIFSGAYSFDDSNDQITRNNLLLGNVTSFVVWDKYSSVNPKIINQLKEGKCI